MRKQSFFKLIFATLAIAALVFALQSSLPVANTQGENKESMDDCAQKDPAGKMSWESLPHQFFSSF